MREKAILVNLDWDDPRRNGVENGGASAELEELAVSAGLTVCENFIFRQRKPNPALLVGKGKAEVLRESAKRHRADAIIMGSDLSPSQQRNLDALTNVKTIDRTQLILDIFAQRARSNEGKLQVELAQLKYLLPRLGGKGVELSRLGGGVGTRGPGEQKLEVDRRRIRERISKLEGDLSQLQERRLAGIRRKQAKELPLVALVGYTNAGKSSLFNRLAGAEVTVKDRLFSTLDTTTRLVDLPGHDRALVVDTVGFVRDLPHHLIESFKATLEEAVHADVLLHVIDASRPDLTFVQQAVSQVLSDLGVEGKRSFLLLNKCDVLDEPRRREIERAMTGQEAYFISAHTGEGLAELKERLSAALTEKGSPKPIFIPHARLDAVHELYERAEVLERRDEEEGSWFIVRISPRAEQKLMQKLGFQGT